MPTNVRAYAPALPRRRARSCLVSILVLYGCGNSVEAPITVETVVVTPATVTLVRGDSARLSARALDGRGNPVQGRAAAWTSLDPTVVVVRENGLALAVGPGRTTVRAQVDGRTGSALVEVLPVTRVPRLLGLAPARAMEGDGPLELVLNGTDFLAGAQVIWNGDTRAATRSDETRLTTTLTTADLGAPGTGTVVVVNPEPEAGVSNALTFPIDRAPVAAVEITPDSLNVSIGQVRPLSLTVSGPGGRTLQGRTPFWRSTAPGVARVDEGGQVTGVAEGRAQIVAEVEGVADTAVVRVEGARVPVMFVIPRPTRAATLVDVSVQFTALVLGPSGGELEGRLVEWWVESPEIARIDAQGIATGLSRGTTRVRATSEGVHGWAVLEVREIPPGSVHVYDARLSSPRPQVGDTLWTDPGGGTPQPAALVLDSAELTLDFETGSYRQVFTVAVIAGFTTVDMIEWVDEGAFGYSFDGSLRFTSTTAPGRTFRALPAGPGALLLIQTVGRLPEAPFDYVIR